jgi:hypothetical protein
LFSVLKTEITTTLHLLFNKNRFVVIECCRRPITIENYLVKSGSDLLKNKLSLNGLIKRKNSRHEFQSLPCDAFGSRTGLIVVGERVEKAEPS